jgi:ABC-2 type transport system permease protein
MRSLLIAKRDLGAYVSSVSAYIIISALLLLNGGFFHAFALGRDDARFSHEVLEDFFYLNWGFAVATAVLLTMRSFADETAQGTESLLRTSVLSDGAVVLGKWMAAMGMVLAYVFLTAYMPALIFVNGSVSFAHIGVGYTGVILAGAVASAIGVFSSALFRNQIASGIVAGVIAVYMSVLAWMIADILAPPFSDVASYTALFNHHFVPFMEGRLSTSSVVYHLTLTAGFLFAATHVLHSRRWE